MISMSRLSLVRSNGAQTAILGIGRFFVTRALTEEREEGVLVDFYAQCSAIQDRLSTICTALREKVTIPSFFLLFFLSIQVVTHIKRENTV